MRMRTGETARGICAALGLLLMLGGCAGQLSSLPQLTAAEAGAYQLGAGDRLRRQVFGREELSQEYLVSDFGAIDVALIGAVDAEGRDIAVLEEGVHRQPSDGSLGNTNVQADGITYRP